MLTVRWAKWGAGRPPGIKHIVTAILILEIFKGALGPLPGGCRGYARVLLGWHEGLRTVQFLEATNRELLRLEASRQAGVGKGVKDRKRGK